MSLLFVLDELFDVSKDPFASQLFGWKEHFGGSYFFLLELERSESDYSFFKHALLFVALHLSPEPAIRELSGY